MENFKLQISNYKFIITIVAIIIILIALGGYFYYKNILKKEINILQPTNKPSAPQKEATFSGTIKDLPKPPTIHSGQSGGGLGETAPPPED